MRIYLDKAMKDPHQLYNLFTGLKARVMLTVARAVVGLVDDAKKLQSIQVGMLTDESRDNVERFQEYGITSVPHPGAEAVVVHVGGNREHGLVIAVDDRRYRVKGLAAGEVCIYSDEGDKVHFKRGKVVEITTNTLTVNAATAINLNSPVITATAGTKIDLITPMVTALEDVRAGGDITDTYGANTRTMAGMRTIYNTHTHNENDNHPAPTNVPNQLMT